MIPTNPIRIWQIDTDRGSRIAITSQHRYRDYLSANSFHLLFLETLIYRRMILKPLRIITDDFCTLSRLLIRKIHGRLPACFHS